MGDGLRDMKQGGKLFYGWVIVAASLLVMMSVYGVVNNCYAFYIAPVTEELGFSRQGYSLSQSVVFIAMMCTAPFSGAVFRRFDMLKVMRAAAVLHIGAYALYGACRALWQFYLVSAVVGMTHCFITTIPIAIILRSWFERSYGLALGIAFMGSGLGGMVFSPVIRGFIDSIGWRHTFFAIAAIMAAVNLVAIFVLMKRKPEDIGLAPLRAAGGSSSSREKEWAGFPLKATLGRPRFWLTLLFFVAFTTSSYGLCTYIVPYYTELGHSAATATLCASVAMGLLALGKVAFGRMLDKIGLKPSALIAMSAMILGFVGMAFSARIGMFALVLVGIVVAGPFGTVAPAIVVKDLFGTRDFGAKLGFYSAAGNLGAALSPFVGGSIYDATGGYRGMMLLLLGLSVALAAGYALVIPGKKKGRAISAGN